MIVATSRENNTYSSSRSSRRSQRSDASLSSSILTSPISVMDEKNRYKSQSPHTQKQQLADLSSQFVGSKQQQKKAAIKRKKTASAEARSLELLKKRYILNQRIYLAGPGVCHLPITKLLSSGTHLFVPFLWTHTFETFDVFRKKKRLKKSSNSESFPSSNTNTTTSYVSVKKKRRTMCKKLYAYIQILVINKYKRNTIISATSSSSTTSTAVAAVASLKNTKRRKDNGHASSSSSTVGSSTPRTEYEIVIAYGATKFECNPYEGKCSGLKRNQPRVVHSPNDSHHRQTAMQRFQDLRMTARIIVPESRVCDKNNNGNATTSAASTATTSLSLLAPSSSLSDTVIPAYFCGLSKKEFDRQMFRCFYKYGMFRK